MNLVGSDGRPLATRDLRCRADSLDEATVAAARSVAYAEGRVLERDGLAVYAIGLAARASFPRGLDGAPPRPSAWLAEIPNAGACTPVALGATPFDHAEPTELVLGEVTVVVRGGGATAITVAETPQEPAPALLAASERLASMPRQSTADRFDLESACSHDRFRDEVARAVDAIRSGSLHKVVLSRDVVVRANRPFRQGDVLERIRSLHPSCLAFAIDGFVGATPELIVRTHDGKATTTPLAGTIARSGDPAEDARLAAALMSSQKERSEHQIVIDEIVTRLGPLARRIDVPEHPRTLELRNVVHLATTIEAVLADTTDALELAAVLHPTPAICGSPQDQALAYLRAHERASRGRYGGLVGYVDAEGRGEWWLGIRSATLDGATARMSAGVGIVVDSAPASELAETQLKLQAMLAVLVRP